MTWHIRISSLNHSDVTVAHLLERHSTCRRSVDEKKELQVTRDDVAHKDLVS